MGCPLDSLPASSLGVGEGEVHRTIDTCLIDLDDCLYQIPDVPVMMLERIQEYMETRLGIPKDKVPEMSQHYYLNFGTTLAGLVADGHRIDFDDWHAFVHGSLPYERLFPAPNADVRAWLQQIRVPKYVFTNADEAHAHRCLELMGVADMFEGVITFERIQQAAAAGGMAHRGVPVVCKPQRPAFELALRLAGGATAARAVFFDDSTRNVAGGGGLGMMTVLVGRTGVGSGADAEVRSLHDVPTLLPDLWCQLTTPPRRRLGHPPGRVGGTAAAAENGGGPPQQQQQQLGEEQQQASAALAVPS